MQLRAGQGCTGRDVHFLRGGQGGTDDARGERRSGGESPHRPDFDRRGGSLACLCRLFDWRIQLFRFDVALLVGEVWAGARTCRCFELRGARRSVPLKRGFRVGGVGSGWRAARLAPFQHTKPSARPRQTSIPRTQSTTRCLKRAFVSKTPDQRATTQNTFTGSEEETKKTVLSRVSSSSSPRRSTAEDNATRGSGRPRGVKQATPASSDSAGGSEEVGGRQDRAKPPHATKKNKGRWPTSAAAAAGATTARTAL